MIQSARGTPRVAVIIPCLDEHATIADAIRSARSQDPAPEPVVVVDNGSVDGSLELARELADVVLERPGLRVGALRNAGAAAAGEAEVLAFLDADCRALPGWLAAGLEALSGNDLVGARTAAPDDDPLVARRWAAIEQSLVRPGAAPWSQHLMIRREAFDALGGFDERRATGEDVDLAARVTAAGRRVGLAPGMRVVHRGFAPTLGAFVRRERWHTSTPGWFLATSPRGRAVVVAAVLWTGWGVAALERALRGRPAGRGQAAAWGASGLAAALALGRRLGSGRYAAADAGLLLVWGLARATRLPRGLRRP